MTISSISPLLQNSRFFFILPFIQLVALDAGIENLTYIISDAPDEFQETLYVMEAALQKAINITIHIN